MSAPAKDPVRRHYDRVKEKLIPWVAGRSVRTISRTGVMEERGALRISRGEELLRLVDEGMGGVLAAPVSDAGEVWFVARLRGSGVPFEAVRLVALKLRLVLRDHDIDAMAVYDGDASLLILWSWGVPDPDEVPGTLSSWHAHLVRGLRGLTERRLRGTPERDRIGRWLGFEGPVLLPDAAGEGVLMEALGAEGRFRVPYSLNQTTGRGVVPMDLDGLYRLAPQRAEPSRVQRLRGSTMPPLNFIRALRGLQDRSD